MERPYIQYWMEATRVVILTLFLTFEGKCSYFINYDVRCRVYIDSFYQMEGVLFYIPCLPRGFIMKECWCLSNSFPESTEICTYFFSFILLMGGTILIVFQSIILIILTKPAFMCDETPLGHFMLPFLYIDRFDLLMLC